MTRYSQILAAIVLLGALAATPARAFTFWDMDLSLKTGLITGTVINHVLETDFPGGVPYGGFPIIIGYNLDVSPKWSLGLDMSFILDPKNIAITRSGLDLVAAYHLLGGSRRVIKTYGSIEIASRYAYNVSLAVRGGFQHYSASAVTNESTGDSQTVSGNVLETMVGLQYRQDTSDDAAFVLEVYMTAKNFSAALDATNSKLMMFLASYRFFL